MATQGESLQTSPACLLSFIVVPAERRESGRTLNVLLRARSPCQALMLDPMPALLRQQPGSLYVATRVLYVPPQHYASLFSLADAVFEPCVQLTLLPLRSLCSFDQNQHMLSTFWCGESELIQYKELVLPALTHTHSFSAGLIHSPL